jgi:hypothetical protein
MRVAGVEATIEQVDVRAGRDDGAVVPGRSGFVKSRTGATAAGGRGANRRARILGTLIRLRQAGVVSRNIADT